MPTAYPGRQLVHWQAVRITAKCRTYRMHYLLTRLMHLFFQLGSFIAGLSSIPDMRCINFDMGCIRWLIRFLYSGVRSPRDIGTVIPLVCGVMHFIMSAIFWWYSLTPVRRALTVAAVNMPKQRTGTTIETAVFLLMSMLPGLPR